MCNILVSQQSCKKNIEIEISTSVNGNDNIYKSHQGQRIKSPSSTIESNWSQPFNKHANVCRKFKSFHC